MWRSLTDSFNQFQVRTKQLMWQAEHLTSLSAHSSHLVHQQQIMTTNVFSLTISWLSRISIDIYVFKTDSGPQPKAFWSSWKMRKSGKSLQMKTLWQNDSGLWLCEYLSCWNKFWKAATEPKLELVAAAGLTHEWVRDLMWVLDTSLLTFVMYWPFSAAII